MMFKRLPRSVRAHGRPWDRARLLGGFVGRIWLSFVLGSLLIVIAGSVLPGWHAWVIRTGSMSPRIHPGDVVLTQERSESDYIAGRVVTFKNPSWNNEPTTHRIVKVGADKSVTTKGDANIDNDPLNTPQEDIKGLGRILVKWAGWPWIWYQNRQWVQLLLFISSLIFASFLIHLDGEDEDSQPDPGGKEEPAESKPRRRAKWLKSSGKLKGGAGALGALLAALLVLNGSSAAFSANTSSSSNSWSVPSYVYTTTVLANHPWLYYATSETGSVSGGVSADDISSHNFDGTYQTVNNGYYFQQSGPSGITPLANRLSVQLRKSGSCIFTPSGSQQSSPQTFSIEIWFKTSAGYTGGGKLIGFENQRTSAITSSQYDRHIYMEPNGKLRFGIYNGTESTVVSTLSYNDGSWHHAVGVLSGSGGVASLYVDGQMVASMNNMVAETNTGYWRIGCGILTGWAWNSGTASITNAQFVGFISHPVVYDTALSPSEIYFHYWLGR